MDLPEVHLSQETLSGVMVLLRLSLSFCLSPSLRLPLSEYVKFTLDHLFLCTFSSSSQADSFLRFYSIFDEQMMLCTGCVPSTVLGTAQ